MTLKNRHIAEDITPNGILDQVWTQMRINAQVDLLPKIHWEKNSMVMLNKDIPTSQIIPKCKTGDFPAESITVRVNSQKRKTATVYFYGQTSTRTYAGGTHTWTYVDETLRVTLPMIGYNKKDYSYSFQGQLPRIFTLDDMAWALDYIQDQFDKMTGNDYGHFVGKHAKYQAA
jgi:hypothetical protein